MWVEWESGGEWVVSGGEGRKEGMITLPLIHPHHLYLPTTTDTRKKNPENAG